MNKLLFILLLGLVACVSTEPPKIRSSTSSHTKMNVIPEKKNYVNTCNLTGYSGEIEFYGDCPNGKAKNGIVIYEYNSIPVGIDCVLGGKIHNNHQLDFTDCKAYFKIIPNFCHLERNSLYDYMGQCVNGRPNGVGFMVTVDGYAPDKPYIRHVHKGMFTNGIGNGYGTLNKAPCDKTSTCNKYKARTATGWFRNNKLAISCSSIANCFRKNSGVYPEFATYQNITNQTKGSLKQSSTNCKLAKISDYEGESEFYGQCNQGNPINGIVIYKYNSIPTGIDCISYGRKVDYDKTNAFENCERYLSLVPNSCKLDNGYIGQCINGVPNGVGHLVTRKGGGFGNGTISIRRGMFSNGKHNGWGFYKAASGCGALGCAGSRTNQWGWFRNNQFETKCKNVTDCLNKISGASRTVFMQKQAQKTGDVANFDTSTFDGALVAFQSTGNKGDLRKAQNLAVTKRQKSQVELELIRIAGYDKILNLTAKVRSSGQEASLNETQALLDFVRYVDSKSSVAIKWSVSPNKQLNYGPYRVTMTIGLDVEKSQQKCLGGFCTWSKDTEQYTETVETVISASKRYNSRGEFNLSVRGSTAGSVFGVQMRDSISGIKPIIKIESIAVQ